MRVDVAVKVTRNKKRNLLFEYLRATKYRIIFINIRFESSCMLLDLYIVIRKYIFNIKPRKKIII